MPFIFALLFTLSAAARAEQPQTSLPTASDEGFLQDFHGSVPGFHNSSELGFVQSQGNSDAQTTNFRQLNSITADGNTLTVKYDFLRSEAKGNESARRWNLSGMFERDLAPDFGAFLYQNVQSDRYAGYNQRMNSEIGARYHIVKRRTWNWLNFVGFRYSAEQRVEAPQYYSDFAHLYWEINTLWSQGMTTQVWADYLYNFSHPKDFQINFEGSITLMLNQILSLKTAYLVRYDNVPAPKATHQRDSLLTTSLVARF